MPGITETKFWDSLATTTLTRFSPTMHLQALQYRPTFAMMMDNYSRTDSNGGREYQDIAEHGFNNTVQYFDGPGVFAQAKAEVALPIKYRWRYAGGSVGFTLIQTLENAGPVALANLLEMQVRQLLRSMNLMIGNQIFGDGTEYGGKTIIGLAASVALDPTTDPASGPVGGIPAATYGWWRNNSQVNCGSWKLYGIKGSTADNVLRLWNNCSDGMAIRPDYMVSDQSIWEWHNATQLALIRYVPSGGQAQTPDLSFKGFPALEYQGRPHFWDRQCPAGRLYMINTDHIHMKIDPRYKFEWTEDRSYPNQLAFNRICGLRHFMYTGARMFSGVSDGWAA